MGGDSISKERPSRRNMSDNSTGTKDLDASFRGHPGSLRLVRRLLRRIPGPDPQIQLRLFHRAQCHAVRGADRKRRSAPGSARPQAGHDAARGRLRLGTDAAAGDGEVRRQRHRPDAQQEPAGVLHPVARQARHHAHPRGAPRGLGAVPQPGRPDRLDRGLRALRLRALRRLLQDRASTSCPTTGG